MAKLGRNEPCPCGSGKKYKACCMVADAAVHRRRPTVDYDLPLLVDGEVLYECPPLTVNFTGTEEIAQEEITPTSNHIRHEMEGFVMQGILSRTTSEDDSARPEYAARGFTWYIRLPADAGGGDVAFFKDVRVALEAHRLMFQFELDVEADEERPLSTEHLNELRRSLVLNNNWPLIVA